MQCANCPNIINYPKPNQKYCIVCNAINRRVLKKKKKLKKKKTHKRICDTCGKEFLSEYKVEKFCSIDCRNFKVSRTTNQTWVIDGKKKRSVGQQKKLRDVFNRFPIHLPKEKISGF